MKIALVIERLDASRGGRERSTAQTAAALARRGHAVTVFCQAGCEVGEGVSVRVLAARGGGRAAQLTSFIAAVRHAARKEGFDILHATLPVPGANVYQPRGGLVPAQRAAALRRRRGLSRLLAELLAPLNARRRQMARLEERVVGDAGTLCLAVSRMVAREFPHHYARSEGVRVIYNAVDVPAVSDEQRRERRTELRRQIDAGANSPVFLTAAMNFRLKGVGEAIAAFARWYHSPDGSPGARLVAVGQEDVAAYRWLALRRRVRKRVHFVPPTADISGWYAAADACILLSWYDPCSRVVLEATRWSIPSITTAYNGAAEVLADGAGIVVASPRDEQAVVAAIAELADPKRRAEHAEACRSAAEQLTMDRHVDELLDAYAEAARKP